MTYRQLKERQQAEMNAFPLGAAFSDKQFEEMMNKWGLSAHNEEHLKQIIEIGYGCFIRRTDKQAFIEMTRRHSEELRAFRKNEKELMEAIVYQLHNHEYGYTRSWDTVVEALEALEIDADEVVNDKHLAQVVERARRQAIKESEEWEAGK